MARRTGQCDVARLTPPGRMAAMMVMAASRRHRGPRRIVLAGAVAASCGGLPSTLHALATGGDLLQATRAAGTLVPGRRDRPGLVAGVAVHLLVSAGWTAALAVVARRRRPGVTGGAAAGLLIAAFDLEVAGRAYPAIRSLPRLPQWLDHVAFGAIAGALLDRGQDSRPDC
jgi:CHASE2 domain-containing sensor protein